MIQEAPAGMIVRRSCFRKPFGAFFIILFFLLYGCSTASGSIDDKDSSVAVPSYWKEYLDGKAEELKKAEASTNGNGVSFAFITDIHVGSNNMVSPVILKYLQDKGVIQRVICGGDIIYEFHNRREEAINELSQWSESTKSLRLVTLLGNHDLNSNNQTNLSQVLGEDEFYAIVCKQNESFVRYEAGELYGYEDILNQRIRFLYLNTGAPDNAVIKQSQLDWMRERILELEAGWTVVVFAHQFWTGIRSTEPKLELDNNGVLIESTLNSIYDHSRATIACVIVGHCHRNYSKQSSKGYPIIATTCDSGGFNSGLYDPDTPIRQAGTITEQSFDFYYINTKMRQIDIIRIGAGDSLMDRRFNY